jgi:hypothetical protein
VGGVDGDFWIEVVAYGFFIEIVLGCESVVDVNDYIQRHGVLVGTLCWR